MKIKIHYYSGAGNLFSIIDNRSIGFTNDQLSEFAKIACSQFSKNAIKTEGLIAIENSEEFPFKVQFFNPDGSSGMMCGNGARCAIAFAKQLGTLDKVSYSQSFKFQLAEISYTGRIIENAYQVDFEFPKEIKKDLILELNDSRKIYTDFIDVGTPHLLINYDQLKNNNIEFQNFNLIDFARPIRYNTELFPNGTNVSIYQIVNPNLVHLRTYERGVESETGACGTATVSLGYLLFEKNLCNLPLSVIPTSQIPLKIYITDNNITLEGPAEKIGEQELNF